MKEMSAATTIMLCMMLGLACENSKQSYQCTVLSVEIADNRHSMWADNNAHRSMLESYVQQGFKRVEV